MYLYVTYLDQVGRPLHKRFPNDPELQGWINMNTDTDSGYWKNREQGGEISKLLTVRIIMEISDLPRTELTLFKGPKSREPFRRFLITEVRTALPEDNRVNESIDWILRGKAVGDTQTLFPDDDIPEEDFAQASTKAIADLLNSTVYYGFSEWTFAWVHPLFETGFDHDFIAARSQWQMGKIEEMKIRKEHEKEILKVLALYPGKTAISYVEETDGKQCFYVSLSPDGKKWTTKKIYLQGFQTNLKAFQTELIQTTFNTIQGEKKDHDPAGQVTIPLTTPTHHAQIPAP